MTAQFTSTTLDNGLTIIAEIDPTAHSAAAGFFVKTGARDEPSELMGVSHFLEHMMFKGTDDLSPDDINNGFDALGARHNAYTSNEITCFYAQTIHEKFDEALALLARMMRPALRQDDFDTEKGVILEEIAMYQDNPFWVLYEEAVDRCFRPHALAHRVLGTTDTITAMTSGGMRGYFHDRYSADNTTLALAGRVDFDRAVEHAHSLCGSWSRTGAVRTPGEPAWNTERFTMRKEGVTRAYMLGLAQGPAASDDRRYAAAILTQVLGMPDNSRLHWALIEPGLADETLAQYEPLDGTGEYFVYASCDPERADKVWSIVDREIAGLAESLTEDDLVRLRAKVATGLTLSAERPGDRMQRLGRRWSLLGEYRTLEQELARIEAVTLADLRETLEAFPITPRTVGTLLPE